MLDWSYAPSVAAPPELYARYTWVKELMLPWESVGGAPSRDEVSLLVEMLNIYHEAQRVKAATQGGAKVI